MTALLLVSFEPEHLYFPSLAGALAVDIASYAAVPLGITDGNGQLSLDITMPQLLPADAFVRFYTQPLFYHPPTGFFLGSGSTLEILDSTL